MVMSCHELCKIGFAYDHSSYKACGLNVSNEDFDGEMRKCKSHVFVWGRAKQVSFDVNKESMHMLALGGDEGSNFKLMCLPF